MGETHVYLRTVATAQAEGGSDSRAPDYTARVQTFPREALVADPFILQAPAGRSALVRGMSRMARLLRVTLGPCGRTVAMAPLVGQRPPEILDSAAIIARRMTGVGDPFEDMGAMIVRHLAWRVYRAGRRWRRDGGRADPGARRAGRDATSRRAGARSRSSAASSAAWTPPWPSFGARPDVSTSRTRSPALVAGTLRDPALAERIGSIVDAVGPDGSIQVEDGEGIETTWEYLEGVRWTEGYVSSHLLQARRDDRSAAGAAHPGDQPPPRAAPSSCSRPWKRARRPASASCSSSRPRSSDAAIALMVLNRERGRFDHIMAAKAPHFGEQRAGHPGGLAVITGGRCILEDRHEPLEDVTLARPRAGAAGLGHLQPLRHPRRARRARRRSARASPS